MKTEVKKRLGTCILLWAAFVVLKWIMLLSPSSIFYKLAPLSVLLQDGNNDYALSGWISIGIETALTAVFCLIRSRKINILYLLCTAYAVLYVPSIIFWIVSLEFEAWRYMQFLPAVVCGIFMIVGAPAYLKQEKLIRPTSKPPKKKTDSEKEKKEKDSRNE